MSWLVEGIPEREKARIDRTLESCVTLSLRVGSSIEDGRLRKASLVAVEDGLVAVMCAAEAGERRMVVALGGSRSLLLPPGPNERLEALTDARLTLITEKAHAALLEVPAAATAIVEALAARLRDCQESLSQFSEARHVGRVRSKLAQLGRMYGKAGPGGVWLSLPLTHEVLAAMVGSTRETVTRAMSQLAREGFVGHERGAYRLPGSRKTS